MERLDKKVVASGLSLLGLVGVGSGIAHADDVKSTLFNEMVCKSKQEDFRIYGTGPK